MVLLFNRKGILKKVMMQRTQKFSGLSLLPRKVHAQQVKNLQLDAEVEIQICPFFGNNSLEFCKKWNKNTL